jgi:membrane dipeptidase
VTVPVSLPTAGRRAGRRRDALRDDAVERWTRDLGLTRAAAELHRACDVIDLHVDSYLWTRLLGFDFAVRHRPRWPRGWILGHADLPRLREGGVTGAAWVVTTDPFGNGDEQRDALRANLERLPALLEASGQARVVHDVEGYRAARTAGRHAAFLAVQGANALAWDPRLVDRLPARLLLATLVHLTSSPLGSTSSPLRLQRDAGLTRRGQEVVAALESRGILVDLAHVSRRGFWDAVAAHDPTRPLLVSHTGVDGVHPHWRNLDDAQLRAIADSGGTVGVLFHAGFLGDPLWSGRAESVVRHLEHIVETVGDDHASLGSDWDGFIVTPRDLATAAELPRLTGLLLARGHAPERIRKILGRNVLRVIAARSAPTAGPEGDRPVDGFARSTP